MRVCDKRQSELRRAEERARAVLKPGDIICVTVCMGLKRRYVFDGWDGRWLVSRSGINDIHAFNVYKLNGKPISFRDPLQTAAAE